jgi:hypothetical protein
VTHYKHEQDTAAKNLAALDHAAATQAAERSLARARRAVETAYDKYMTACFERRKTARSGRRNLSRHDEKCQLAYAEYSEALAASQVLKIDSEAPVTPSPTDVTPRNP